MIGVKNILMRYKIPVAVTAFFMVVFAGTAALSALSPPPGTPIVNSAFADYSDAGGNRFPQIMATVHTPISGAPVLSVVKTASTNPVAMGSTLTYTIDVVNTGNLNASNVVITDYLSKHTEFQSSSAGGVYTAGPPGSGRVVWNIGTLIPGQRKTFTVTVRVKTPDDYPAGDPDVIGEGTVITNTAEVVSTETSGSTVIQTLVGESPNTGITQAVSTAITVPEGIVTYTITYNNTGNEDATGVYITNRVPELTSLIEGSITGGGTVSGDFITWYIGTLESGSGGTVSFSVRVSPLAGEGDTITNSPVINSVQQGSVASEPVYTIVVDRTQGEIGFFNENWKERHSFSSGDTLYIQVDDPDRNIGSDVADTVVVTLTNPDTGDTETVILTETGADTGIFRGSIPTTGSPPAAYNGMLSVAADTQVTATYTDPYDPVSAVTTTAYIDPYGVVFDSVTGNPIQGVVVTLMDASTSTIAVLPFDPNPAPPTGVEGKYSFPLVPEGTYYLVLTGIPAGYTYPSAVPDGQLPAGFSTGVGSRGESFTLILGMEPLNLDIPIDPSPGQLAVEKSVNRSSVSIGDIVRYTITVSNNGDSPVNSVYIYDTMPHGIDYVKGSSSLDGTHLDDPVDGVSRTLVWLVPEIATGTSIEISYTAVVGIDSHKGDGKNIVSASGTSVGQQVSSNKAYVQVRVSEGVFTSKGTIIGKVFIDSNSSGMQEAGEEGIDGVAIYMEDGTRVVTDSKGKYSIPMVEPGTHVLRIDSTTLSSGDETVPISSRFAGTGDSQFVDVARHGLSKANFAVRSKTEAEGSFTEDTYEEESEKTEKKVAVAPVDWEDAIKEMSPEMAFLNVKEGMVLHSDQTRVILKSPLKAKPVLYVNGEKVGEEQIGRRIEYEAGNVAIREFVGIRLTAGEKNTLKAELVDGFGNVRAEESVTVLVAGHPEKVVVTPEKDSIPADGRSEIPVHVDILDREGNSASYSGTVTLLTEVGTIKEKDVDNAASGHQVPVSEGKARFTVIAPYQPAECEIKVYAGKKEGTARIDFVPHLRDMFIVGTGEIRIGHGEIKGGDFLDDRWLKDGLYLGGRGAFFAKGRVFSDILLTAAYDSEKEETDDFFRESERNTEGEERYPVYGDESKIGYEALSTDRLYVRMDRGMSHIMYGDYHTGLNDSKLSAYSRTFTGFETEIETERFSLHGFVSYTSQSQYLDTIRGRGISGYYYLSHLPVVEGSEKVVIETRDRYRTDRVIKREIMVAGSDYWIDYDTGAILFKSPVPSLDISLNPVFIIVSYESDSEGEKYYIYGGRAAFNINKNIEIGLTSITEEREISDYHLLGADITIRLPKDTTIKAEWAQTRSLFDIEGIYTPKEAEGWLVEIESSPLENLFINGYYRNLGDYFGNLSATDIMRGTEKYGAGFRYLIGGNKDRVLFGEYFNEDDRLYDTGYEKFSVGVENRFEKTKLSLQAYYENSENNYILPPVPDPRYPFDITQDVPEEAAGLHLSVERKITDVLALTAEYKGNFLSSAGNIGQAGIEYQIEKHRKLYVRQQFAEMEDRSESRIVAGVEAQIDDNTVAFNEYSLAGGMEGNNTQQSIGLRNRFLLGENITGNLSVENLYTVSGPERQGEPDAFAIATGIEYLPGEDVKMTSRLEYRDATNESSRLAEFSVAYKINPDYTLLFRERLFYNDLEAGSHTTSRTLAGVAYRPVESDRFNALARLEFKKDKDTASSAGYDSDAYIASVEGIYQADRHTQITGKYAGKFVSDYGMNNYTDLVSARITRDIGERFDIGLEYRMLNSHKTGACLHGGSAEVGYRIFKNVWLSLGYSFDSFDTDLTGDNYSGRGPFIRMRIKFDESLLKALR